jgi:hypothetical protein
MNNIHANERHRGNKNRNRFAFTATYVKDFYDGNEDNQRPLV